MARIVGEKYENVRVLQSLFFITLTDVLEMVAISTKNPHVGDVIDQLSCRVYDNGVSYVTLTYM